MRNFGLYLSFFIFLLKSAYSYQLVSVESISSSKKTFLLNLGKKDEIYKNKVASFSTDLISFEAIAIEVSRDFSQWKILEKNALIPVTQGSTLVMHTTGLDKGVNALGESTGIYQKLDEFLMPSWGLSLKIFNARGVNQSISKTNSQEITSRSSNYLQIDYHSKLFKQFYYGLGLRSEVQEILAPTYISETTRYYVLTHLNYFFRPFTSSFHDQYLVNFVFVIGTTMGLGTSSTRIAKTTQSGYVVLIPTLDLALRYSFFPNLALELNSSIESIIAKERLYDSSIQNISELNVIFGVGIFLQF